MTLLHSSEILCSISEWPTESALFTNCCFSDDIPGSTTKVSVSSPGLQVSWETLSLEYPFHVNLKPWVVTEESLTFPDEKRGHRRRGHQLLWGQRKCQTEEPWPAQNLRYGRYRQTLYLLQTVVKKCVLSSYIFSCKCFMLVLILLDNYSHCNWDSILKHPAHIC